MQFSAKREQTVTNVRDRLIGCWRMVDWKVIVDDRVEDYLPPLGLASDGGGILIYSAAGLMSAMRSRTSRPKFRDGSLDGGAAAERAAAVQSLVSYAGTVEVDEAKAEVTHVAEYASHPIWSAAVHADRCRAWKRLRLNPAPLPAPAAAD